MIRPLLLLICLISFHTVHSQERQLKAKVIGQSDQKPVEEAFVNQLGTNTVMKTDAWGLFVMPIDTTRESLIITISHPDLNSISIDLKNIDWQDTLLIQVNYKDLLEEIQVDVDRQRTEVSITKIDPKQVGQMPSPFQDISNIIATLPGVAANNELSNQYSVRGGNFDENLVYVNDIPIHRPFVIRAGQQEGLSFINMDMTESIVFSAGGWQAQYGDALSSVMNITYQKPNEFHGTVNAGLLGGSVFASIPMKNNNGLSIGLRHKDSRYLIRTLDVEGQYFPRFTDLQLYYTHDLSEKTSLDIIGGYSNNDFQVNPQSRETDFGAFPSTFRLFVGYAGQESLTYNTWQGGLNLSHRFNSRFRTNFIVSGFYTNEREFSDVEYAYRLCSLGQNNNDPDNPDPCRINLGAGRGYEYRRNRLQASNFYFENKYTLDLDQAGELRFGAGIMTQAVNDMLNEYSFVDSTGFVDINHQLSAENSLWANQIFAYAQHQVSFLKNDQLTYGVRLNYWDYSGQLLVSPRIQYAIRPEWKKDIMFRFATGLYQQPAFYREIRDFSGQLTENLKAQSSVHAIAGMDQRLTFWGRQFTLVAEAWAKYMYNVIPYDIDNVRIRYYANNNAEAAAAGFDVRMGGEFIPGSESWFSLGILNTQERLEDDERDWQRRPSDQRLRLGVFFQDHFPNDPSYRVFLNVQVGTGLPFGPPNNELLRNSFVSPPYRRVDLGLSKEISFVSREWRFLDSIWLSIEVLNLLGSDNPISFNWVQTIDDSNWAVPNSLSARFFNFRTIAKF